MSKTDRYSQFELVNVTILLWSDAKQSFVDGHSVITFRKFWNFLKLFPGSCDILLADKHADMGKSIKPCVFSAAGEGVNFKLV